MTKPSRYYSLYEGGGKADVYIFGEITSMPWMESDVSSHGLVQELSQLGDVSDITVHINSYGGEVAEGAAIYNALRDNPAHVTTVCDGMACSIASVIFMAGDDRIMQQASALFVHNAWTFADGNAEELRKLANDLEVQNGISKTAYMRGGIDEETLTKLMDAETWLNPQEAVEYGFATAIDDGEDSSHTSQLARGIVVDRLTRGASSKVVANVSVQLTDDDVNKIVAGVLNALHEDGDEHDEPDGDEGGDDPTDEPDGDEGDDPEKDPEEDDSKEACDPDDDKPKEACGDDEKDKQLTNAARFFASLNR